MISRKQYEALTESELFVLKAKVVQSLPRTDEINGVMVTPGEYARIDELFPDATWTEIEIHNSFQPPRTMIIIRETEPDDVSKALREWQRQ